MSDLLERILPILAGGETLTAKQISQRLGASEAGIQATLRGQAARKQVTTLRSTGPGVAVRYRLRGRA